MEELGKNPEYYFNFGKFLGDLLEEFGKKGIDR